MRIKISITLLFIVFTTSAHSQKKETTDTVSFITVFDETQASKDGYHLKGYIVEIPYKQAQKLHRKRIRITGKVFVTKALDPKAKDVAQGREEDTRYISNPTIKIIQRRHQ